MIPQVEAHFADDDGHLSLIMRMPEIVAGLRRMAGLAPA